MAFDAALAEHPALLGWKTPPDRLDTRDLTVTGDWPGDLKGRLYRNGPAAHDRFGQRYRHWFDGDSMIQEFAIDGGRVAHRGRLLDTPKLKREEAAGKRLYGAFGTAWPVRGPITGPDDINVANISVLHHAGELMALWEGGSPTLIDPATLAAAGFKTWRDDLEGVAFSAHPKIDPDGTLWSFGYGPFPRSALTLYHIAADGGLVKAAVVDPGPIGMIHDFAVTDRSLVIVIPPFAVDPDRLQSASFLDAHVWQPDGETRVMVVDKSDFSNRRWYSLPAGFGFHHGNAWEESDGTIRYDHCWAADPSVVTETLRYVMKGEMRPSTPQLYTRIELPRKGEARIVETGAAAEFPKVAPTVVGRRNRWVYTLGMASEGRGWDFRTVVKRDVEGGSTDSYDYGDGFVPEEHVFVPRPGGSHEDDGWLIGTALDWKAGVTHLSLFDAGRLSAGPVAQASLPYPLPLGLHGIFVAE